MENESLDKETLSNLEKTLNAGTTLLGLVNNILDISKIESGKLELSQNEYNVASVINDTVAQSLVRIRDKPVEFKLDVDKGVFANLIGDELRLKQIMNNILSNAMKYTARGEVRLSVYCRRESDAVWLMLCVSDTGQGIKKEDLSRIFNEYAQVEDKVNRTIEGTGLGLPITKRLCELMDGSIEAESEYGKGSVFTVKLKQFFVSEVTIGDETISSLKKFRYHDDRRNLDKNESILSLPDACVLVVDDNRINLDVARGLMKPYGMHIDCVESGQKAIDAIIAEPGKYDAVFMDHMMPGMNGVVATQRIRALATDYAKNVPIIALTANAIAGNEEMFLSNGFQAFLSKPIDVNRLDAVIRQWVFNAGKEQAYAGKERAHIVKQGNAPPVIGSLLGGKSIDGIDLASGVALLRGNEELYISILRAFTDDIQGLLNSIEYVDQYNLDAYLDVVHGIKGACYNICAAAIGSLAETLETAAMSKDLATVLEYNPPFISAVRKFISDLREMLASINR